MKIRNALSVCALLFACAGTSLAAHCSYSLAPASASFDAAGGGGSFSVTAGSSCSWTATTANGWIHTTNTGTGNGIVGYAVDANESASQRLGQITVGNQTFAVTHGVSLAVAL